MRFKRLLKALPIMALLGLLGVGVLAAPVGAAAGTLTIAASGSPGETIQVNGTGFTAGNAFTITFNGVNVATGVVANGGIVTSGFIVPVNLPHGNYTISYLSASGVDTVADKTFTINPLIILSAATGPVGTQMAVSGRGFDSSTAVSIYFDTYTTTILQQVTTDLNGTFTSTTFLVPQLTRGSHEIHASQVSGLIATLPFTVISSIGANIATGYVGDSITITGTGFGAGNGTTQNIVFRMDGNVITGVTSATSTTGNFSKSGFIIPPTYRGSHLFSAEDGLGGYASFAFTVSPKIVLSTSSGTVGSNLTITGTGFTANTTVAFTIDGASVPGVTPVTTSEVGGLSVAFVVPPSTSGAHTIAAADGTGTASASFSVVSKVTVSPTTGSTGDLVNITGTGFFPNSQITLAYDSIAITLTAQVALNGTFSGTFAVPGSTEGPHTIIAADGQGNVATTAFTSSITASLTPDTSATPGFVGQDITVTGNGFKPTAAITVKLENNTVATGTSNATGAFTITFKAPVIVKGAHPVTVSDGQTTKTFTFTMEGTAPQAPALTEPASGIKAKQPITFTWGAVTDQSNPVTYKLEVATDANFTSLIISEDNLTTTSYTMTDVQKLPTVSKKAPYYWRVTATDSAGNVSSPSTASTFVVGFAWADVPLWAWLTIGVFAIVIIGGGVYLFLKRRSGY